MKVQSLRNRRHRPGLRVEFLEGRILLSHAPERPTSTASANLAIVRRVESLRPTSNRWSWMADTYWYVPTPNLSAVVYSPTTGSLTSVADQTVFHLTGYRNGYFWGETVSQLGGGDPSSSVLVGSVTPQGRVLLTFTSSTGVVTGYGVMSRRGGGWAMENQMFATATSAPQIGHWAYMVQTRPGRPGWDSLPSAGVSVPTFLSNYSGPRPTPVTI